MEWKSNPEKECVRTVEGRAYARLPVSTPVIRQGDDLAAIARAWAMPYWEEGDLLFLSEKAVACSQGRAIPLEQIAPSPLARFLSRFVHRQPGGIGLAMPETMEMALQECGRGRVLLAAAAAGLCKLVGVRGMFYRITGTKARAIDGPCSYTLPPYDRCVVLAPDRPNDAAKALLEALGTPVVIIDANDRGVNILGCAGCALPPSLLEKIFADNPLGQSREQTPMGILRAL